MFTLGLSVKKPVLVSVVWGALVALSTPGLAQCNPSSIFATPTLYSPGGCPLSTYYFRIPQANAQMVAFADVNGDGKQDMIVAQAGNNWELAVALGNGDGTFQAPIPIYPGVCCSPDFRSANFVVVGDFNGDGKPDVALGTQGGYVTILLGNGDGTFTLSQYLTVTPCCSGPVAGAVGDFNGDGKLDLAVVNSTVSPGVVDIYLGNGNGTVSQSPVSVPINASGSEPNSIVVGDFNKDGKLDFATTDTQNYPPNIVSVALGNGNGTFQPVANYTVDNQNVSTGNVISIVSADFNGDGYPDIATLSNRGLVEVLLNKGDGTFPATPVYYFIGEDYNNAGYPRQLAVADFNKDGHPDLVAVDNQQDSAAVLLNNSDGTFASPAYYVFADRSAASVAVADINGDGNPDFVISTQMDDSATIFLGNGDGTFHGVRDYLPLAISQGISTNVPTPTSVGFGDFNGDGKIDMAVTDANNNAVTIFLNNGDGTFKESANYNAGGNPSQVRVADLNGDGKPDLVVGFAGNNGPNGFSVLIGNGDGTFKPAVGYSNNITGGGAPTLALADVNGDGKLDVVASTTNGAENASFYITLGNGDGTFQQGIPMFTPALCPGGGGQGAAYLLVTDVNGDGKQDIVGACDGGLHQTYVSVLLGKGDGTFGAPTQFQVDTTPVAFAAGDYNKDGKIDLAVVNNYPTPEVSILLGNGNGTFQPAVNYSVFSSTFWQSYITQGFFNLHAPEPDTIVAADFNGDGKLDLLVGDNSAWTYFCNPGCGTSVDSDNGLQLFLGNGDGTFQAEQSFLAGQQTSYLAVADLNGDGAPDVAAVNPTNNFVAILLNQSLAPPIAKLSGQSLSFGNQAVGTTSGSQNVTLSNTGGSNLNLSSISITGTNAGDFKQTNNCPAALAANANCTIAFTFAPTAAGARSASLSISDNATGSPQTVSLSGTGTIPIASIAPSSAITFPAQLVNTTSSGMNITLTNTGGAPLNISGITITGTNASDYSQTNTCGSSVAASGFCTISLTFHPAATGARTASLSIVDNASGSPQQVSLSGTGTAPAVTLVPSGLTFPAQGINTSSGPQPITLTNSGTASLTVTGITISGANPGDYGQTNTCGVNVAAGANCTINVTFTPTASGSRTASLSIADNAAGNPQTVSLSGTGAPQDYSVSASPGSATVPAGSPATFTLSVSPAYGFSQAVSLSCSGLPSLSSCSFSPVGVTPSGSAATSTLTISTTPTTTSAVDGKLPGAPATRFPIALAGILAALFSFGGVRKRSLRLLSIVALIAIPAVLAGCGGHGKTTVPGTPPGSYTVTVTAASGTGNSALSHNTTVTLTVQ